MQWTKKVEEALERSRLVEKLQEIEKVKKYIMQVMATLIELCLSDLKGGALERTKVETLVTIHVHQRDVVFDEIATLVKAGIIKDEKHFDWCRNTRIYWKPPKKGAQVANVVIEITDVEFTYSYEYLGAKERLCITQLTDRCYVTLAQALGMFYGGAPAGPAGTGKTETVKDLGRTLGIMVVVTNCSPEQGFRDMANIFKGLC